MSNITREETREKVVKLISDQLSKDINSVVDDATLESLGADSLDYVELIMKLEETFSIEIQDTEAEKLKTIGQLVDYVFSLRITQN